MDFPGVLVENCGNYLSGTLKLRPDVVSFKATNGTDSHEFQSTDVCKAQWLQRAKGYCLRLTVADKKAAVQEKPSTEGDEVNGTTGKHTFIRRYDGLSEKDEAKIMRYLSQYYGIEIRSEERSLRGWNWGEADFQSSSDTLNFKVDGKPSFEIPLKYVTACNTNKNEAALELHQNPSSQISLMEIRFFVPPSVMAASDSAPETGKAEKEKKSQNGKANPDEKDDNADDNNNDDDHDEENDAEDLVDPLEEFRLSIMQGASVMTAAPESDAIGILPSVNCLVPRGRYDMRLYPTFVDLHGKSYDYKIPYSQIVRAFLLPHKDSRQMFFVVSVDPPLKQGQTRYPFVILQFNVSDQVEIELSLSDEVLSERYGKDALSRQMSGAQYDIVCKLFRSLGGRKITVPGSYTSRSGARCISCSFKASSGLLYPLERGFIFIHKPPIYIKYEDVNSVDLGSTDSDFIMVSAGKGLKTFNVEISMSSGTSYIFSSVDREEKNPLAEFLRGKDLRIKVVDDTGGSSSSRDDRATGTTSHDAYLNRLKEEGEQREAAGRQSSNDDDDDDDDEDDEDFQVDKKATDSVGSSSSSSPGSSSDQSDAENKLENDDSKAEEEASTKEVKKETVIKKPPAKRRAPKEENATKPRRKKRAKDPNAPKRPQSAYMLWMNESRARLKEENPSKTVQELMMVAGEEWRKLTDKTTWTDKYQELKKQYDILKKADTSAGNKSAADDVDMKDSE